ncbi:hypothetical protein TSAR_015345 [Trichomalopsis sarcophagae]|uniref:Uncharacterized protein n=1 Tax=Trichomalopsis sarcophagae TaxID=543379 RepID=A0A232ENB2_9HYME|nr:hypothetical protein TSAR_015345 [Trichomalopsis sarcophagae]
MIPGKSQFIISKKNESLSRSSTDFANKRAPFIIVIKESKKSSTYRVTETN